MSEPVYQLTLTATQLAVVRDACEVMARVNIAQLESVAYDLLPHLPTPAFCEVRDGLTALNRLLPDPVTPEMADRHRTAWVIYHAARYRLYLDACAERGEAPQPGITFSRPPHRMNDQPVPEVTRVD